MYKILENGRLEKLAKYDFALSDIEDKTLTEKAQHNNVQAKVEKNVQIADELLFKNKVMEQIQ